MLSPMFWIVLSLVPAVLYLLIRGFFVEPQRLDIERKVIRIAGLPSALDGVGLLHLTDLHLRPDEETYNGKLLRLVDRAMPDVVALTGDYTDSAISLAVLGTLAAKLSKGRRVFAVLGDNDLCSFGRAVEIERTLKAAGVRVLRNEGELELVRDRGLFFAGIDDPRSSSCDLASALQHRGEQEEPCPVILLSHSAEIHPEAEAAGVDLLLSGHTHGGQVCLPLVGALYTNDRLGPRFASGLINQGPLQIHVSRGVGWAKLRVRLFCPPEITLLILRQG